MTSCKGGVGKSTCAANTAAALAARGNRTLLVDCSFDMRCLDLLLGLEDEVVYDLSDAALGRAPLEKCIISDSGREGLHFLAAPYSGGERLGAVRLRAALEAAARSGEYDFVILDTPGMLPSPDIIETGLVTGAVIVASHNAASIRAADATGDYLAKARILAQKLIINRFDFAGAISGARPGISEIIDRACVPLGGIVPEDSALMLAAEGGRLACETRKCANTARAFANIAARLEGRYVTLFDGFDGLAARRRVRRLLG